MRSNSFSDELKQFVYNHIDSVEQMEVLFYLYREKASALTAPDIAAKLYVQPESVAERLASLVACGLCVVTDITGPRYQYEPDDIKKDLLVRDLMEAYRTRHVAVISLIFSKPPEHLRLFSDAFKIRKDSQKDS